MDAAGSAPATALRLDSIRQTNGSPSIAIKLDTLLFRYINPAKNQGRLAGLWGTGSRTLGYRENLRLSSRSLRASNAPPYRRSTLIKHSPGWLEG